MIEMKFHHVMPIFVARQWIRHRTANVNEYSGRYSVVPDRFYKPTADYIRKQSAANRQGGTEPLDELTAQSFLEWLDHVEQQYEQYEQLDDVERQPVQLDEAGVRFELTDEAATRLDEFTGSHLNQNIAIVKDKTVIWYPPITRRVSKSVFVPVDVLIKLPEVL